MTETVYTLQAGEGLTKEKFVEYFEKKVRKTIRTYDLFEKKEKILVAVSGGKDSTSALYILRKIFASNPDITIEAMYIDPTIQTYSPINRKNIEKYCKENKIPLHIFSYREEFGHSLCYIKDLLAEKGMRAKSCAVCGVLRRHLLNKKSREMGFTKLVTGHNLDDEAQNIMMNFFQNHVEILPRLGPKTGLKNSDIFIPRVKPLYFCTEEETELYSRIHEFPVKYEQCPCSSDAFRRSVGNMLNSFEKDHKQTKTGIIQSFLKILPKLKTEAEGTFVLCDKCGEPSSSGECSVCSILDVLKK